MAAIEIQCPGLPADWLNAWLAALGTTILVPGLRLSWSDSATPVAQFSHADAININDVGNLIAGSIPTSEALSHLCISATHPDSAVKFAHKITPEAYRSRAIIARSGDPSLGWIATDLAAPNDDKSLRTSSFYTGGPGPVGNLHDRLMACRSAVTDVGLAVQRTLAGTSRRVEKFGLGFDYRRITPPTDPNRGNWVDPIVEAVAFFGLAFFPVRGTGEVFHKSSRAVTRGWTSGTTRVGGFRWTTWKSPLDAAAIDAMLDRFWSAEKDLVSPLEGATFESVPYKQLSTADPTRGYGSRRVQHGR